MTKSELYWLAGWLEGEGTFYFSHTKSNSPKLCIQAFSVDYDVIYRAATLAEAKIYAIKPRLHVAGGWDSKHGWRFNLERLQAESLMRSLLPLMGKRRTEQITKALNGWENRANKPISKLCACGCGRTVFGGPRLIYARRGGACAQQAYRKRQKVA